MTSFCEDAPCCGCCSPAALRADAEYVPEFDESIAWAAEAAAEAEYENTVERAIDDGTCCELGDCSGNTTMALDVFGFFVELVPMRCDYCDEQTRISVHVVTPEWDDTYGPQRRALLALWKGAWSTVY